MCSYPKLQLLQYAWVWVTASSMTTVATAHGVDDCKYWYSWYPRFPLTQCSVHGHIYDL